MQRRRHLPAVKTYRRDVGAGQGDCAQKHQGAGLVVLYRHHERPSEADDDWRRVWGPETSCNLRACLPTEQQCTDARGSASQKPQYKTESVPMRTYHDA